MEHPRIERRFTSALEAPVLNSSKIRKVLVVSWNALMFIQVATAQVLNTPGARHARTVVRSFVSIYFLQPSCVYCKKIDRLYIFSPHQKRYFSCFPTTFADSLQLLLPKKQSSAATSHIQARVNEAKQLSQQTWSQIGAGVAGLQAARHLLRAGFQVMVLEAAPEVGGRICWM